MSKYRSLIIYLVCKLFFEFLAHSQANSTSWTALNLLVDGRREYTKHGYTDAIQTTETYGIIIKSNESVTEPASHLWTKIQVSHPPAKLNVSATTFANRYHATLGHVTTVSTTQSPTTPASSSPPPPPQSKVENGDFAMSVVDGLMQWANQSLVYLNSTHLTQKGANGEKGHAFFDDDDDDDDDDDYDDDDDEDEEDTYDEKEYKKKIKDEVDDGEDGEEPPVEEVADPAETEAQEEFDSYAETRPPIILRTRRKNKRKHGKKHGHIKIKHFKKLKKFMLPLLLAYKLKFFTLVPLLLGGLVLIVATTGFAGFFFALFAVGLGLKHNHH